MFLACFVITDRALNQAKHRDLESFLPLETAANAILLTFSYKDDEKGFEKRASERASQRASAAGTGAFGMAGGGGGDAGTV